MELKHLEKRVDWLDDERRKDKISISQLQERILSLEGQLSAAEQNNKTLKSELTHFKTVLGRMDRLDDQLTENRAELTGWINQIKKQTVEHDAEIKKLFQAELRGVENNLVKTQKKLKTIPIIQSDLQARKQEDKRIVQLVSEFSEKITEMRYQAEEQSRFYRVIVDGRHQDVKRVTDLQSEEYRGRFDVINVDLQRTESRLKELLSIERERHDAQIAFIEGQSAENVEREKTWKNWVSRFEIIESQAAKVESHLRSLENTHLETQHSQKNVSDLINQVERRINELTEMQRLAEDRFRQEWTTFKADDQKRWTNYLLSHGEQQTETDRRLERVSESMADFEDNLQEVRDYFSEINELTWKRLQLILEPIRDLTADHERLRGSLR
jgi:chromosome segregation ATPase